MPFPPSTPSDRDPLAHPPAATERTAARWLTLEPTRPDQVPLRCWWAEPLGRAPRAGVLVLPEVFGVNPWVRSVAERLAAQGYGALAMPLFARTGGALELAYTQEGLREGRSHKDLVTTSGLLADLTLATEGMKRQLEQAGSRSWALGCVGFCFGGHGALWAATLPCIAATCDFYGAGVATTRPGGGPPSLAILGDIPGRLLCVCGRSDTLIPPRDVEAIERALAQANRLRTVKPGETPHSLVLLEGGHGFMCEARSDYHPGAAAQGWRLMLELFAETLR